MKHAILLFLTLMALNGSISAQAPSATKHPGVVLYEQQKFREAIKSLQKATKAKEYEKDAALWNYLGLSWYSIGEVRSAAKAFEKGINLDATNASYRANLAHAYLISGLLKKAQLAADEAVRLDPKSTAAYQARTRVGIAGDSFETAERDADMLLVLDPTNASSYILKAAVLLATFTHRVGGGSTKKEQIQFVSRAVDTIESGLMKVKDAAGSKRLESDLESLKLLHKSFSKDLPPPGSPPLALDPGVTPYRILTKPRPEYTDQARKAGVEGVIRLSAILREDGQVGYVLLFNRLGYGLDEAAVSAARSIRFEPKRIDGKPVSVVVTIEYSFDIY